METVVGMESTGLTGELVIVQVVRGKRDGRGEEAAAVEMGMTGNGGVGEGAHRLKMKASEGERLSLIHI